MNRSERHTKDILESSNLGAPIRGFKGQLLDIGTSPIVSGKKRRVLFVEVSLFVDVYK